jgi:MtrB/PioB family decaheme-associated outer membrane protein
MRTARESMKLGVLAAAVQGALLAMFAVSAQAQDDTVTALTTPDNTIEVGAIGADKDSNKFGEYTGLRKSGAAFLGNFNIRGGDYGSETGIRRWSVYGTNLGLTSREFGGSISDQGRWNLGIDYDELQHNTTTGYQTPYQGSMGGNNFTLPAGFGTAANTQLLNATTQLPALHTVDVHNTRKNTALSGGYYFSPQWRITVDFNNLEQSGAKLMAFGADAHGGANGERVAILPNPTDYTTNTVNVAVDWIGEKGHLTGAYYASDFKDHYDRVTWTTFAGANTTDTMSTAPSNQFHQFSLTGGYKLPYATKLTGGLSYGRNTQNESFVTPDIMVTAAPVGSLDGLVVTEHADGKLVNQSIKGLSLSAGFKYDKRDNRTSSHIYNFNAIDGGNPANYPNTPYSYHKDQYELAGDYRITTNQHLRLAYNRDDMKRSCNNYAVYVNTANPAQQILYPAGTNCVVDTDTKEDKFTLGYRVRASDRIDLNAGYIYADRKTTYDQNAVVAMIGLRGGTIIDTGVQGTVKGLNGGDYQGFHPLFDASRKQQVVKGGVNFQATDKLSLGVDGRYTDDNYSDNPYGPQNGKSWNLNLDATFNYSDNGSVFGYISQDYRDRTIDHVNRSNTTSNAYLWSDKLKDQGTTYGLGFKQGGLMHEKLDIKGDLTYSDAKSNYSTALYYTFPGGTTTSTTCAAVSTLSCGSAPDITDKLTQFKLTGTYKVDKKSSVRLAYIYQKLSSTDYFYNGYQYSYTPTGVMPTNQQSGSYTVNAVAASYIYSFK